MNNRNCKRYSIDLSDSDYKKLNECCVVLGLTKAEVIRLSIEKLHSIIINRNNNQR